MDFTFTPEQDEAAELAASDPQGPRHQRAAQGRRGRRRPVRPRRCGPSSARPGCSASPLPEEYDGAGLGLVELCRVLVEVGRTVAPVPLAAHGPAARLLAELGTDARSSSGCPAPRPAPTC